MDRMISIGPGDPQDAPAASGVAEAAPYRLGKLRVGDIVRAAGEKKYASGRSHRGAEARELAIAAQRRGDILARLRESGRIGDDDVEALAGSGKPGGFAKGLGAVKTAGFADLVEGRGLGREFECRLGTVDAQHSGGPGASRLHREGAVEAIEVEDPRVVRQRRDEPAVVALVEEPPGLLPRERIGQELGAVL